MKPYGKTIIRSFRANLGRFIAISAIIFLGIAFVGGLGTLSPVVTYSFGAYLSDHNVSDGIVKSTSATGFTQSQLAAIGNAGAVAVAQPLTVYETQTDGLNTRVYVQPLSDTTVNRLEPTAGRLPENAGEILAERSSDTVLKTGIGETVELLGVQYEVVGIVANPLLFARDGDTDYSNGLPLERILYLDVRLAQLPLPVTDVYVRFAGTAGLDVFSDAYQTKVQEGIESLQAIGPDWRILSLKENKSYAMLEGYCDKIDTICAIFPVFFIAVAALTVLTTMSRLIEEERYGIGCFQMLGYSNRQVLFKYLLFSLCCCVLASALGLGVGMLLLPRVIYPVFGVMFFPPEMSTSVSPAAGLIAAAAMLVTVLAVTLYVAGRELRGAPAATLRPKAPKPGRKIFLEKLPFLWKRLSFRQKSTCRNIFRYVNHFIMTVVSVAGSTALVFAGFALYDVSQSPQHDVGALSRSFSMISAVIIVFALLLSVFVLYNLTDMNIDERKREIATLKVLGYHEREVLGYVYREIFIMALIGILLGIPLGCGLIQFVLTYIDFGSLGDVRWYSYLLSGGLVVLFIALVDLLLNRKIRAVDMLSSLKSVE